MQDGPSVQTSRWRQWALFAAIFAVVAAVYALVSWDRVKQPSPHFHFVDMAWSFLNGRLDTDTPRQRQGGPAKPDDPPGYREAIDRALTGPDGKAIGWNDWASYRVITLNSGETVAGVWPWKDDKGDKRREFRTLTGEWMRIDPATDIARGCDPTAKHKKCDEVRYYISFPPVPSLVMMPLVAIWGYHVNDVLVTILFAALNAVLIFGMMRVLSRRGHSERQLREHLWLTALFAFGTVAFFSSVRGEVWFTALVIGLTLNTAYILASLDARHPLLAGAFLVLGFATRTPILFATPFFLLQLWWARREDGERIGWAAMARRLAWFSVPGIIGGIAIMWFNYARFGAPFEFGHTYLVEGARPAIREHGLFSFWFLNRNLSAMLTNMPVFSLEQPFVQVTRHGLGLIATTPAFLALLWPKGPKSTLWWSLLITVLCVSVPAALYQNTGWAQFGYRFSLDWTPYLIAMLAIDRRHIGRGFIALILIGVVVNLFGAATFGRANPFYYD